MRASFTSQNTPRTMYWRSPATYEAMGGDGAVTTVREWLCNVKNKRALCDAVTHTYVTHTRTLTGSRSCGAPWGPLGECRAPRGSVEAGRVGLTGGGGGAPGGLRAEARGRGGTSAVSPPRLGVVAEVGRKCSRALGQDGRSWPCTCGCCGTRCGSSAGTAVSAAPYGRC